MHIVRREIAEMPMPGTTSSTTVFHVFVDDTLLTNCARPFDAATRELILEECAECGHCGTPNTSARRVGSYVVWMPTRDPRWQDYSESPCLGKCILVFDAHQYEATFGGSTNRLPRENVDRLLPGAWSVRFPDPCLALYTEPTLPADPSGNFLIANLRDAFQASGRAIEVVPPPRRYVEVRVTLDQPDYPSAVYRLAVEDGHAFFCLMKWPDFAFWFRTCETDHFLAHYLRSMFTALAD